MAKPKKTPPALTEAEWLACADPVPMVAFVRDHPRASPRVWRLFLAAFWGWQSNRLPDKRQQNELRKRAERVGEWAETGKRPRGVSGNSSAVFFNSDAAKAAAQTARCPAYWGEAGKDAAAIQQHFLRDLFGPHRFREITADPDWLTSTAVALAKGIYEERAFDRLPILADALQDAGCDDGDILTHCRDTSLTHARGCWVVDLVLGKS